MLFLEVVVICYVYGWREYILDLRSMFGVPRNKFTAIFGLTGHYMTFIWRFVAPVLCAVSIENESSPIEKIFYRGFA